MVDVAVGSGGSGGIGGIPTKYVLIGAGVLGVAALLLYQQRGGGGSGGDSNSVYGAPLGPNAALALGGLQTELMQQSGYLQELFTKQNDALGAQIGGLGATAGMNTQSILERVNQAIGATQGAQNVITQQGDEQLNRLLQLIGLGFNIREYQDLYHAQQAGGPYSIQPALTAGGS